MFLRYCTFAFITCIMLVKPAHAILIVPPANELKNLEITLADDRSLTIYPDGKALFCSASCSVDTMYSSKAGTYDFETVYSNLLSGLKKLTPESNSPKVMFYGIGNASGYSSTKEEYIAELFDTFKKLKNTTKEGDEKGKLAALEQTAVEAPAFEKVRYIMIMLNGGENIKFFPSGQAFHAHMQSITPIKVLKSPPKTFDLLDVYNVFSKDLLPNSRAGEKDAQVFFYDNGGAVSYYTPLDDEVKDIFKRFDKLENKTFECEDNSADC